MGILITWLSSLGHPWLLRRSPNDIRDVRDVVVTSNDFLAGLEAPIMDDISEQARASTLIGPEYVERVKALLAQRAKRLEEAPPDGIDETGDSECSICYEQYSDERITPCCHSFCEECLENIFNSAQGNADLSDDDVQAGRRKCPLCRSVIDKAKIFRASAFMPVENDDEDDDWGPQAEEVDDEDVDIGVKLEELNDHDMSEKKKGKRKAVSQKDYGYQAALKDSCRLILSCQRRRRGSSKARMSRVQKINSKMSMMKYQLRMFFPLPK